MFTIQMLLVPEVTKIENNFINNLGVTDMKGTVITQEKRIPSHLFI